jgi:hypothetical protein
MTANTDSQKLLRNLCDKGFEGDVRRTALALGRTEGEVESMLKGEAPIDEDLEMKIKGIADEREIPV